MFILINKSEYKQTMCMKVSLYTRLMTSASLPFDEGLWRQTLLMCADESFTIRAGTWIRSVNRAVLVLTPVTITHETGYFVSPLVTLSVLRSSSVIHACSLSLKLHLLPIVLLRCLQSASVQAVKDKLQQETHLHSSCDRTIIRPMTDTYSIWVMLLKGIRSVKSCTFT